MKQDIRIASPCSANWNRMAGDERVRYCPECKLDVYNFSEMSDADVESIISHRNGRLCARFYERSDGTMLTRNCPVGLRAVVRRISRFASAALAAVISVSPAFAKTPLPKNGPASFQIQPVQTGISLEVVDANGGVISKARIAIVNEKTKVKIDGETDASGRLQLVNLPAGNYEITVSATGFKVFKQSRVSVPSKTPLRLQMEVGASMGVVVVVAGSEPETTNPPICKTLTVPPSEKPK
jgi:Carboxypeptidase regulatory-like domain